MLVGRKREIETIVANCADERLSVVVAEPGVGLTTLLEEGIRPALAPQGYIVASFSNWQGRFFVSEMKEQIANAVRAVTDENFFAETETLREMLERTKKRTGRKVALLLDQFEDYLRCHQGTDLSDSFDAELADAIVARSGVFVIGFQAHALHGFERLRQYIPNLTGFTIPLSTLSEAEGRELIALESEERGIAFEPAVTDALLDAKPVSAAGGGIHPFFLARGITRLTDAAKLARSGTATSTMLEVFGSAERLILESLDNRLNEMNPSHGELFFRWCNILISPDGRRLAVTEKALKEYSGKLNRFAASLIPQLMELQLVRTVITGDTVRYEIARESFTPMVRDWWERREAQLIARRRANFRVRSLSIAIGAIVTSYVVWLIMTMK